MHNGVTQTGVSRGVFRTFDANGCKQETLGASAVYSVCRISGQQIVLSAISPVL